MGITTIGGRPGSGGGGGDGGSVTVSGLQIGQAVQAVGGTGLLPMDGRVVSKASYPELYAALNAAGSSPLLDLDVTSTSLTGSAFTYAVAFNAASSTFAAINLTNGSFYASADNGQNWVTVPTPVGQTWRAIYSNGSIFVAVGATYTAISADGMSWTNVVSMPIAGALNAATMAYANGEFHLYGEAHRVHLVSTNGYTWVSKGIPLGTVHEVLNTGAGYIAYGYTSGQTVANVSQVAISSDNVNWTLSQLGSAGTITGAATFNGLAVIAMGGKILLSSDHGVTWTNTATLAGSVAVEHMTATSTGFLAACRFTNLKTSLWTSADGVTWTQVTNGLGLYQFSSGTSASQVFATNGTRWIFSIANSNIALMTNDFDSWSIATLPLNSDWSTVIWNGSRFTILADTGTSNVYSDDNGATWSVGSATVPVMNKGKWAVNSNGVVAVVGAAGVSYTSILTSVDGITFTARTVASGQWLSIAAKGTTFVAVNTAGACVSSADGITFTARSVTTGTSVAASGSVFVTAKGASGANLVYSSPDGITWTQRTMAYGSGEVHDQVFWNGSVFVTRGNNGTSVACNISSDGITWIQNGTMDVTGHQISAAFNQGNVNKSIMIAFVNNIVYLLENSFDITGKVWNRRKVGLPSDFQKFGMVGQRGDGSVAVGILGPIVQHVDNGVVTFSTLQGGEDICSATYNKLIWTGTEFIAQTSNNASAPFHLKSTDGVTWTKNASPINGYAVSLNDNLMIANSGGIYAGNSTDGFTFMPHSAAFQTSYFSNLGMWIQDDKVFIAYNASAGAGAAWASQPSFSEDGLTLKHTFGPAINFQHDHLAVKGNLVVGVYSSNSYYSEDGGYTWSFGTVPSLATVVTYNAIQDVFVAVYTASISKCLISKDGKNWTAVDLPATAVTTGIGSIGKTLIIPVTTGEWFYSSNAGSTWNTFTNPNTSQTWGPAVAGSANGLVAFATGAGGRDLASIKKTFDEANFVKLPSLQQVAGAPRWFLKAK